MQAAYDPLGRDPRKVLEMATFYELIDGKTYTRLDNHGLRKHDFSPLLPLDRAVLFGRLAEPIARIDVDGGTVESGDSLTFVRLVMPVEPSAASEGAGESQTETAGRN
jgi:hypothetical protein